MLLRSIPAFARQLEPAGWLCTGVVLQSFLFHVLPPYVSLLPTALVLALTAFQWPIIKSRSTVAQSIDQVYKGRYTAQLPAEDGTLGQRDSQPGVVMFAIGATCNQYEFLPSLLPIHSLLPYMENIIQCSGYMYARKANLHTATSPQGRAAPGFQELAGYLMSMWKDAEAHRQEWGCKSPTSPLPPKVPFPKIGRDRENGKKEENQ